MRKAIGWAGVGVAVVLLSAAARADEKIPRDKVPAKVMAAVKDRFPGAELTGTSKTTEEGKVVYDIELKHKGRKYEMDILEDGTVIEIEKEVAAKDVPAAVTRAVLAKYAGAKVTEVMEVNKVKGKQETPDHYEVLITTADGKKLELEVALDGKTVKAEGDKK